MDFIETLAKEFQLNPVHVGQTVALIDDGNTIPFIARYRKELTGSLDDQVLRELGDRLAYLRGLAKRKQEVSGAIAEQEKLTEEISSALEQAVTLSEVEDIYRPFKQKRKTRASMAKERGLAPLAESILEQAADAPEPLESAQAYVNEELGVPDAQSALNGAMDIIAEIVSDDADIRKALRAYYLREGLLQSQGDAGKQDSVYQMYCDYSERVSKIPSHRILAVDRGERDGFLKVTLAGEEAAAMQIVSHPFVKPGSACTKTVAAACQDAYSRLIFPSIERDIRGILTERACNEAIKVFSLNLKNLLLQPPVKGNVAMGLDPGYRTGCKLAVVDETGKVLATDVIYPAPPHKKIAEAEKKVTGYIQQFGVTVIAIGNGTASKETEVFAADLIGKLPQKVAYMVVSEAGASVYSASKLAAKEFPDYDVSLRSAVSIVRRLQDPLAELVKIDPKAVGVGQYQHDMPKKQLDEALGGVVESCVNSVGVDLNTASGPLLSFVAGIGPAVAQNIVNYRSENGGFTDRKQLLKVEKLGKKAFEQCAGFLRVPESKNVLDQTGVHPESYAGVKKLLDMTGYTLEDVKIRRIDELESRANRVGLPQIIEESGMGAETLKDVIKELQKPGRDPRDELPKPMLRTDVLSLEDLHEGMELMGTVRNVIDFGAFVDIGVHEDGLVHISQLSDRFIKHPSEAVKVGDIVKVRVLSVDAAKKRIGLTMKGVPQNTVS